LVKRISSCPAGTGPPKEVFFQTQPFRLSEAIPLKLAAELDIIPHAGFAGMQNARVMRGHGGFHPDFKGRPRRPGNVW
jgi:hypothetical protein